MENGEEGKGREEGMEYNAGFARSFVLSLAPNVWLAGRLLRPSVRPFGPTE